MEIGGLFVILEIAGGGATPLLDPDFDDRNESLEVGDERPFMSPISME